MDRPTSLVVIALLWLPIAAGWVLSGLGGLLTIASFPSYAAEAGGAPASVSPEASAMLGWMSLALAVEVAAGCAGLAFSIGLLCLRPWGRKGLEGMTVILLGGLVLFFLGFVATSLRSGSVALGVGGILGLGLTWPVWIMRRHLRSGVMREAVGDVPPVVAGRA